MTQKSYFRNLWIWKYFESLTKVELQKTLIVNFRRLKVFCMHVIFLAFNMTPLPNGQFTNVSSKNRLRIFSRIQMVANIFSWLCQKHFFFSQQDLWMMARLARDMYHAYRVKEKYWASYINLSIQCWRNLFYKIQN